MSFLAEWQKQQKALKDAERNRKKNASSLLNNYRGGEHDIKDQKQQKALRDADRDEKKNASSILHNYRGGEHDIKDQRQLKALKDAERDKKKNASSFLHNYRGGEHDIKDQTQQKALKEAERYRKKNTSSLLHNYRGGEHNIKNYERVVVEDRKENHTRDQPEYYVSNGSVKVKSDAGETDDGSKDVSDQDEHCIFNISQEMTNSKGESHSGNINACENAAHNISEAAKDKKYDDIKNVQHQTSTTSEDMERGKRESHTGKSRKSVTIDFSFGIIYPDFEPMPGADSCASAASVVIPHMINQWTNETKILCNPKRPEVIGEIVTDDWYDGDGSIRYKVKGKVAVQVFAESSANEVADGLKKVLRRHISFRPVTAIEVDKATKEKKAQLIIGDGAQKWMRVREGRLGGLGITF